ncbi:MAG: retroviral-like aspartic protease family protein [Defluviitaleaceae bacterium]|nr:retroviral-like aspartic protease family protein [Defluviitaleaceae bacterium]
MLVKEIPIDETGFVIIEVYIKPKNSTTMKCVKFKVDSGANFTTISSDKLFELGYDEEWIKSGKKLTGSARPTVANGKFLDDCYEVVLPEINIGGFVGRNWHFLTSPTETFRLLFGTNSMKFFNWNFDYENTLCRLTVNKKATNLLFDKSEQSIHAIDELGARHGS